jgi:hypothetical protein
MGSLSIGRRWDEHGVTGPPLVHLIERGIVLGDHKHLILMLLPGNANQPVVKKRQVRLAHSANDHSPILGHKRRRLCERVVAPLRKGRSGGREDEVGHARPGQENPKDYQKRQEN